MAMYYVGDLACDPNYLAHHGIKGQKWGVRRFQNPDGTLTEAGKKRYGYGVTDRKSFVDQIDRVYKDTRLRDELNRKLSYDDQSGHRGHSIIDKGELFSQATDELNKKFSKYSKQLEKERGEKWDGDGTEEHMELVERYPEYAEANKNYVLAKKNYLNSLLDASQAGYFDDVLGSVGDMKASYKDYKKVIDGKAFAASLLLNYGEAFDEDFATETWYKTKKNNQYMKRRNSNFFYGE